MLNKFENGEAALSTTDPRRTLEEAWEQFFKQFTQNRSRIQELDYMITRSCFEDTPDLTEVQVEEIISREMPMLAASVFALRRAFDALEGWRISWRTPEHRRQWETIEVPSDTIPGVLEEKSLRLPRQFHEWNGWIKGSLVGVDPIGSTALGAWIMIAFTVDQGEVRFNFGDLLCIELSPPEE
ncbi:TPA: hypothetical protein DDX46_00755 [Candidatus Saccharibacteria bacterium]|nr:MAG: hypothetical protein UW38_C0001G0862 [Candidatus Saccharibacteria bacterium GW2011_GWC2_44_17]OGL23856.1 MAG: hypothetical protein A2791_03040 [Candidatus Saccharibacteria bacterium RIFCSPHIGHO2_01_FULL_46_30]OGL33501.1 MAG: hypothetical protein A3E20_01795 [Candidatus Saccharibacteria bacterium RIFCSPHIGHO2_12_FULL_47_16]HBH77262.1 hypothetical protein [Candidatus Saccharibacteria bacterium]